MQILKNKENSKYQRELDFSGIKIDSIQNTLK